ncbi:ABC transporter permease [Bradyrhizobium sp. SYSU BS000235]|uniref:ABC transporter permease n=1 Tax=Bradyrhizobium sp. SYSU BS000235 TaxID=3411332 RepID=UPI003C778512
MSSSIQESVIDVEPVGRRPSRQLAGLWMHPGIVVCVLILLLLVAVSVAAPLLAPFDPLQIRPRARLQAPSWIHLFGTDGLGRDVLSRVLYGGQVSLLVGVLSAFVSAVLGTIIGLVAGFFRTLDAIMMRFIDGLMAIPSLLLAIAIVSLVGPSVVSIVAAISIAELPRVVRLVRGVVLSVREATFVQAAVGLGIPNRLIIVRHIFPNCLAPLVVQTTFMFAAAILAEAVLGFLGVGFPPEIPSWGNIIADGRSVFQRAPWTVLCPSLVLSLTVLSVNILGDRLRDMLDPKFSKSASAQ